MKIYSVEVDRYNPMALANCLERLNKGIPDFEYDWTVHVNSGGIDYGIFLNINVEKREIEICNQPFGNGDDMLDDVLENFSEDDE